MIYSTTSPRIKRAPVVTTPLHLSRFIHTLISQIKPKIIFDPCVGRGHLTHPWMADSTVIGYDLREIPLRAAHYRASLALQDVDDWPWPKPDLILMNPPFNGTSHKMMLAEYFLWRMHTMFPGVPTVLITSVAFRHNQKKRSRRLKWLSDNVQIDSAITLPTDTFKRACVMAEVLFFNCPFLKPHYFWR